jgi:rhodanese-related sulfurtransferase
VRRWLPWRLILLLFAAPCSTVGYRSAMYAQRLRQRNIEAVNLRGSILAWVGGGSSTVFVNLPYT